MKIRLFSLNGPVSLRSSALVFHAQDLLDLFNFPLSLLGHFLPIVEIVSDKRSRLNGLLDEVPD